MEVERVEDIVELEIQLLLLPLVEQRLGRQDMELDTRVPHIVGAPEWKGMDLQAVWQRPPMASSPCCCWTFLSLVCCSRYCGRSLRPKTRPRPKSKPKKRQIRRLRFQIYYFYPS